MPLPNNIDAVTARREEIIARSVAVGERRASVPAIAIPPVLTAAVPAPVPSPAPTP